MDRTQEDKAIWVMTMVANDKVHHLEITGNSHIIHPMIIMIEEEAIQELIIINNLVVVKINRALRVVIQ